MNTAAKANFFYHSDEQTFHCDGPWTLANLHHIEKGFVNLPIPEQSKVSIDIKKVSLMDSAGAYLLEKIQQRLMAAGNQVQWLGMTDQQQVLLHAIHQESKKISNPNLPKTPNMMYLMGEEAVEKGRQLLGFLAFWGELFYDFLATFRMNKSVQWKSILANIEETGYQALPIVALLSFLMGVVLAYQMGLQLKSYGANIFVVNILSLSLLREFAPLMTAIIIAGRTASSFTAQIGTMKVNQEVDALRTMGMSPFRRLVIPKMLGLFISLPLLTFWSAAFGILGGMLMSKYMLGINFYDFIARFEAVTLFRTYMIGMAKAPVFALIIAAVGCFQGMQVGPSSEEIGKKTTKSVVQLTTD